MKKKVDNKNKSTIDELRHELLAERQNLSTMKLRYDEMASRLAALSTTDHGKTVDELNRTKDTVEMLEKIINTIWVKAYRLIQAGGPAVSSDTDQESVRKWWSAVESFKMSRPIGLYLTNGGDLDLMKYNPLVKRSDTAFRGKSCDWNIGGGTFLSNDPALDE